MQEKKKCYSCRRFRPFAQTEIFNGLKVYGLCGKPGEALPCPVYLPRRYCEEWEARDNGSKA